MCIMVYIGSDKQLPTINWNEELPDFNVDDLREDDYAYNNIKKIIDKKFLYYVGAHTGCGCGFSYGLYELLDENDIQDDLLGKKSVEKLINYIKDNLYINESISMYSCWAGNDGEILNEVHQISIDNFKLNNSFCFKDTNVLRIINV